jgi:hypothetical protein
MILAPLVLAAAIFAGRYAYRRRTNESHPTAPQSSHRALLWGLVVGLAVLLGIWWWVLLLIVVVPTAVGWGIGELVAWRSRLQRRHPAA